MITGRGQTRQTRAKTVGELRFQTVLFLILAVLWVVDGVREHARWPKDDLGIIQIILSPFALIVAIVAWRRMREIAREINHEERLK